MKVWGTVPLICISMCLSSKGVMLLILFRCLFLIIIATPAYSLFVEFGVWEGGGGFLVGCGAAVVDGVVFPPFHTRMGDVCFLEEKDIYVVFFCPSF